MNKYYPPQFKETKFNCVFCGVFAKQTWSQLHDTNAKNYSPIYSNKCTHCGQIAYWHKENMVIPEDSPIEPPHNDMPEEIVQEYNEARFIFKKSPGAAAALLRQATQKLLVILNETGKNLDDDIKSLVEKGLPAQIEQSLNFCKVIGNDAVQPGVINLKDSTEIAENLFSAVNFIIEDRISQQQKIDKLYNKLPEAAKE